MKLQKCHIASSYGYLLEDVIWEYSSLCREYEPKSQWTKIWDLCHALYFTHNDDFCDVLSEWLNEYKFNDSLECCAIRGDWDQLLSRVSSEEIPLLQAIKQRKNNHLGHLDIQVYDVAYQRVSDILSGNCNYDNLSLADRILATARFSRQGIPRYELFALAQRMQQSADTVEDYLLMGMIDNALAKSDDLWLQTHLGFTLVVLDIKSTVSFPKKDGFLIVDPIYLSMYEYAKEISTRGLWKEAVGYLCTCLENRQLWIKELLNNENFKSLSLKTISEVLDIAVKNNLEEIQDFLHFTLGRKHEANGETHSAAIEYAKANSCEDLERLAQIEFKRYLEDGQLGDIVMDTNQVKSSPQYTFLSLYKKFRGSIDEKRFKEASTLFLRLVNLEIPKKFDAVLLVDNDLILTDENIHYSYNNFIRLITLFKTIEEENEKQIFACDYYNLSRSEALAADLIWPKIRERISFKMSVSQI
ncbi:Nup85 nucleoporin-domain-containing protein [Sporodiniella umbellata]|nr:Nup85 nucleoporin-domain-containing protein [Sporodiniella umbellata]